ncbi:DUF4097 family beta strand repeat-containing protein [Actinomadura sp. GC306]|uniref:DUF4097 family beta strand repeat-containing protein n=1 Tax=Actinomadura sp. GC306 TaxID=2530367 RepID=UPI0014047E62|nr:DUF4097 family beta strand repeat-containing protein [Actinomadura sp. GC306]
MKTLTATATLAVAAAALTGCGNVSFGTGEETRTYTAPAGITALKLTGNGSRVQVRATDTPTIKVVERLRWSNERNKPVAKRTTEGDTLTLAAKCARATMGFTRCGVSYRVEVPRDLPVEIDNRDGSIDASGLAGTVKLHSHNGSIEATDLRATSASIRSNDGSLRVSGRAATADLDSSNGSIDATGLTADRLTARSRDGRIKVSGTIRTADLNTANGSIDAAGLTAESVTAETRDGSVRLGFVSAPTKVKAESANGSIHVWLPSGESYAIDASTNNGGKRIDPSVHLDSASTRTIDLRTSDGSITVTAGAHPVRDQRSW